MNAAKLYLFNYSARDFPFEIAKDLSANGLPVEFSFCSNLDWNYSHLEITKNESGFSQFPLQLIYRNHKANLVKRSFAEIIFGIRVGFHFVKAERGVLILCDVPLLVLFLVSFFGRKHTQVIWHQDLWAKGISRQLENRKLGRILGKYFTDMEIRVLKKASHIITIDKHFLPFYEEHKIPNEKLTVIENWSPVFENLESGQRESVGSCVLYSGTLGLKHDIQLLSHFADELSYAMPNCVFTLTLNSSAIESTNRILGNKKNVNLLQHLDRVEFNALLRGSRFGLALLGEESSEYSIPSKIFTYISNGLTPIGLMPMSNPAAKTILGSGGAVFEPNADGAKQLADWIRKGNYTSHSSAVRLEVINQSRNKRLEMFDQLIKKLQVD